MNEQDWKSLFEVQQVERGTSNYPTNSWYHMEYILWNKQANCEQGRYRDEQYAIKQAKHKFKKLVKRVDKILLT
jgi:hypothetical protein